MDREALIHFLGGAAGGTAGTAMTCPLEVVKTRMQSSHGLEPRPSTSSTPLGGSSSTSTKTPSASANASSFRRLVAIRLSPLSIVLPREHLLRAGHSFSCSRMFRCFSTTTHRSALLRRTIILHIKDIIHHEGIGALYKGLGPNLIGVAPSKAVYFYTYSSSKRFWNDSDIFVPNSAIVHMISAGCAGFVAASVVNPIWLVKTRLQLHHGPMTIGQCVRRVYNREGFAGFYRGVTASYMGISETMIQFVLYEHLRSLFLGYSAEDDDGRRKKTDFFNFMAAGGTAKFFACVIAYPHEVVRTRLREEDGKHRGFFKTLRYLYRENGIRSLYRGLSVQLLRTVPNTAITMGTYELVVYLLHKL